VLDDLADEDPVLRKHDREPDDARGLQARIERRDWHAVGEVFAPQQLDAIDVLAAHVDDVDLVPLVARGRGDISDSQMRHALHAHEAYPISRWFDKSNFHSKKFFNYTPLATVAKYNSRG